MISPEQLQQATAQLAAQETTPGVLPPEIGTYDGQGQGVRKMLAGLAGLAMLVGVGAAVKKSGGFETRGATEVAAAALHPTTVPETILPDEVMGGIGEGEIAFPVNENTRRSIGELAPGFAPEDLAFGNSIDMALHVEDRGATAFSQEGACNGEELSAFFLSGTPQAEAVKKHILESSSLTDAEKAAKLEGQGFIVMQVKKPAVLHGTTYYVNGEVRRANERSVQAGDLYLLSLRSDGTVDQETSARCDCINPNIEVITPQEPGRPTAPPVTETPPTSEVPPTTETTVPEESTTTTPGSTSSTTSTSTTSSTSTTTSTPETTTTTTEPENEDKDDDEETSGPDDTPTPTTQPAPEEEPTPDDDSENSVGSTSTTSTTQVPGTTTTTPTGGPTTTAPQTTTPTTPQG